MKNSEFENSISSKRVAWWIIFLILICVFIFSIIRKVDAQVLQIQLLLIAIQMFGTFVVNRIALMLVVGWGKNDVSEKEIDALKIVRTNKDKFKNSKLSEVQQDD